MAGLSPSQQLIYDEMMNHIPGAFSDLSGPLDESLQLLRMPISSSDGRKRTWRKTIKDVAQGIGNNVSDVKGDCWLAWATASEDFKIIKLNERGTGNKWTWNRIIFVMYNPHLSYFKTKSPPVDAPVLTLSHRCNVSYPHQYSCVNPYHAYAESQSVNESRKGCVNGCLALCPHVPDCIFTNKETGRFLQCLNYKDRLANCSLAHDGGCWGQNAPTAISGAEVPYQPSGPSSQSCTTTSTAAGNGRERLLSEVAAAEDFARTEGVTLLGQRKRRNDGT